MSKLRIEMFYDIVSPYSAIGWNVIQRYAKLWPIKLELRPFFLGGVMKVLAAGSATVHSLY